MFFSLFIVGEMVQLYNINLLFCRNFSKQKATIEKEYSSVSYAFLLKPDVSCFTVNKQSYANLQKCSKFEWGMFDFGAVNMDIKEHFLEQSDILRSTSWFRGVFEKRWFL